MSNMKILLVCGHGAGDPGAIGNGYKEADLVREIAPRIKSILSSYADVTLFDTSVKLSNYLAKGNRFNFKPYDYVFELHFNAISKEAVSDGKTKGTEILVHTSEKGVNVENLILQKICSLGFRNRGVKPRNDLIVMNTCKGQQKVSYALLEVCFIDDIDDMALYQAKKNDVIKAIVDGITEGFGLKVSTLTSAYDITEELNKSYFPITEKEKFVTELEEAKKKNSSLYWGYYKLVNKIK